MNWNPFYRIGESGIMENLVIVSMKECGDKDTFTRKVF